MIDIKSYEGIYSIDDCGNIWSHKKKIFLKPRKAGKNYLKVNLYKNGKNEAFYIHRLVALHFILNLLQKPDVNHIDGNKSNNYYKNLEWITKSENTKHAYATGLIDIKLFQKLSELEVKRIRLLYKTGEYEQGELANIFKISKTTIRRIINYQRYKNIV